MVFALFRRAPPELSEPKGAEAPTARWSKDDEIPSDQTLGPFPVLAPSDQDARAQAVPHGEAEEEGDGEGWDWDVVGASPPEGSVGALVIDDYLTSPTARTELVPGLTGAVEADPSAGAGGCGGSSVAGLAAAEHDGFAAGGVHVQTPTANKGEGRTVVEETNAAAAKAKAVQSPVSLAGSQPSVEGGRGTGASKGPPLPEREQPSMETLGGSSSGGSPLAALKDTYSCGTCNTPVFSQSDIISSNYQAMTGPGYLIGAAHGVRMDPEVQTVVYISGRYSIQDIECGCCSAKLGVTYVGAADARNHYKVGKFLVGRDRLQLPPGAAHPKDKMY